MSDELDIIECENLDISSIGLLKPGIAIEHPSLGIGVVENIYKIIDSGDISIKVNFNDFGSKKINPKHAHMKLVKIPEPDYSFRSFINKLFFGGKSPNKQINNRQLKLAGRYSRSARYLKH